MNESLMSECFKVLNERLYKKENVVLRSLNSEISWDVTVYKAEGFTLEVSQDKSVFTIKADNFELISFVDGSFQFQGDPKILEKVLEKGVA